MKTQTYQSWWYETFKLYVQYLGLSLSAVPAYFIVASFVGYNVLDSRPATIAVLLLGSLIGLGVWMIIDRRFPHQAVGGEVPFAIVPNLDVQFSWPHQIASTSLVVVALTTITTKGGSTDCYIPERSSVNVQSLN